MMKQTKQTQNAIIFGVVVATALRLLSSVVLISHNTTTDKNNVALALGPGTLPALRAAVSDPVHTWDHLEEACFWLGNSPSSWEDSWDGSGGNADGSGYNAIYTSGTRVVAPPLVVALLGEMMACTGLISFRGLIQNLLLLIADAIGAFCIYHLGVRIFEMENRSNEEEMERHTQKDGGGNNDLVVPGILRPLRGWIFGLSFKIIPPEEALPKGEETDPSPDVNEQKENGKDEDSAASVNPPLTSPSPDREPIIALDQLPIVSAVSYFCNPVSMVANAIGSIRSLWDALLLLSLYYATMPPTKEGMPIKIPSATKATAFLAMATYADFGYGVFLLPILLWRGLFRGSQTQETIQRRQHRDWKMVLMLFAFHLGGMHYIASMLVGGDFSTYRKVMVHTMLPNIAFVEQDASGSVPGPSMGLHWYMFVQVFDRFRPYFTVFVNGLATMFAIPLASRLYRYPSVLVATFQLLWAIFRPTTTVHTLTLGLHMAALNPRTIVRMRNPSLISAFALPVPILLFMTFHRMWLVTGNGNPNYIYFQCFAYGMFVTIITLEFVSATVKRDKVRRMVEKGTVKKILAEKKEVAPNEKKKVDEKEANKNGYNTSCNKEAAGNGTNAVKDDKPTPEVVFL